MAPHPHALLRAGLCLLLLLLPCACAGAARSPFMRDDAYLQVGVDPDAHVAEIVASAKATGWRERLRVRGRHFTAVAFVDGKGVPAAVRVVTAAGIALAVDSESSRPGLAVRKVGLLASPRAGSADADGDGFEEVFVSVQYGQELPCIAAYRVRDVGFVDAIRADPGMLGPQMCVTALRDVDGDGYVELLATWAPPELALRGQPSVEAVLSARNHGFALAPQALAARYYGRQADDARARLLAAQDSADGDARCEAAATLAMIAALGGGGSEDPGAQFDAALGELQLDAEQSAWAQRVRAFIVGLDGGDGAARPSPSTE